MLRHAFVTTMLNAGVGGGVAVHPGAAAIKQDRPAGAGADRAFDGPPDRWRQRGGRGMCARPAVRLTHFRYGSASPAHGRISDDGRMEWTFTGEVIE